MTIVYFFYFIEKITKLFSDYGYQVRCFYNRKNRQILDIVSWYSQKKDSASLICFISSHGDQTSLSCPDGNDVEISDILNKALTTELDGCPKVFFIDACRKFFFFVFLQHYKTKMFHWLITYFCIDIFLLHLCFVF